MSCFISLAPLSQSQKTFDFYSGGAVKSGTNRAAQSVGGYGFGAKCPSARVKIQCSLMRAHVRARVRSVSKQSGGSGIYSIIINYYLYRDSYIQLEPPEWCPNAARDARVNKIEGLYFLGKCQSKTQSNLMHFMTVFLLIYNFMKTFLIFQTRETKGGDAIGRGGKNE